MLLMGTGVAEVWCGLWGSHSRLPVNPCNVLLLIVGMGGVCVMDAELESEVLDGEVSPVSWRRGCFWG